LTIAIDKYNGSNSVCLWVKYQRKKKLKNGGNMDAIYFLIIWVGSALLHTLYDLKIKPYLLGDPKNTDEWPFV